MSQIKMLVLTAWFVSLFTLSGPAYAQDATLTARQPDPASIIVMVVGIVGLLFIGLLTISGRGSKDNGK